MNAQILTSRPDGVSYMKGKRTIAWGCGMDIKKDDRLFIYFREPYKAIRFFGIALEDASPTGKGRYRYETKIKITPLRAPITIDEMREMFPRWKWLTYPRQRPYLNGANAKIAQALWNRAKLKLKTAPVSVKVSGGGFGRSPEQIRKVEKAACSAVKLYFREKGYELISCEKENRGYDFDVRRNKEELHVEVKGVSGSMLKFPITTNEIACAKSDTKFKLAVVTEATTPQKKVHIFDRKDFLKSFELTPLAYFAEANKNLRAR